MGNNSFAPGSRNPNCFVVQNITTEPKVIMIFNYPINPNCTRDLLKIPGVAEDDIRSSLLKGEIKHKILTKDIVVLCSDIDLLQFNDTQKAFLMGAGIVNGLAVGTDQITNELYNFIIDSGGGGGGGITTSEHETLRQLIHFIDEGPGDGFASGAYKEVLPSGNPFPTSIIWYLDSGKTKKLVEKLIIYDIHKFPFMITWNMYNTDGVTIVHTITDTITYNAAFESTRTRTIS
jgi:hypothetical protein